MSGINEDFVNALLVEDDLGRVVRSHIFIESKLEEFIASATKQPHYLKKLDLTYEKKVLLALLLGLTNDFEKPLKVIGTIRNTFAHNLDAKLAKQEANNFIASLSPNLSADLNEILKETVKRHDDGSNPLYKQKLREMLPADQFVVCMVFLDSLLTVATVQNKANKPD